MPEWGPSGSVRGALGNGRPYRDPFLMEPSAFGVAFPVTQLGDGLMAAPPDRPLQDESQ